MPGPAMTPGISLQASSPPAPTGFVAIAPAVVAATAFAFADVSTKVTLHAEADVLTMALFRGIIGVPLLLHWLMVGTTPKPLTTPSRRLALFIGLLFAGNVFFPPRMRGGA